MEYHTMTIKSLLNNILTTRCKWGHMIMEVLCLTTLLRRLSLAHHIQLPKANWDGTDVFKKAIFLKVEILILVPKSTIRFMSLEVKEMGM